MPRRSSRTKQLRTQPPVSAVRVLDPSTQETYVLLRADLYDRSKALFEEDIFGIAESYPLQEEVARREGWDDPAMDAYDRLDPRRSA